MNAPLANQKFRLGARPPLSLTKNLYPKARLNAAQTVRCAFSASSTAGIMPKKAWIMPGYSWRSTGTPAALSLSP
jgi:hypothetical protein